MVSNAATSPSLAPGPAPTGDAKGEIRDKALADGFDAIGFAPAQVTAQARQHLHDFVAAGYHGDMGWMARNIERRGDMAELWPAARSAIVLGLNYGPKEDPLTLLDHSERGNISVYARNRDYHDLFKKRLKALARWLAERFDAEVKIFVDTAPVMEKHLAQRAGLGWQGKHTNLVSRDFGSWLFLGEILTTMELAPDTAGEDSCGSCRQCLSICPTQAFPAPYKLDARRCISYLTIEHKGHIDRDLRPLMGNRIYGCDDCLAVCPWNKFAQATPEPGFLPRVELTAPRLADLAGLDDTAFRAVFAGSPIKRTGRDRFVRNVLIALGNCGDPDQAKAIAPLLSDPSPLVRAMAVWALSRLLPGAAFQRLRQGNRAGEEDPWVQREWDGPA